MGGGARGLLALCSGMILQELGEAATRPVRACVSELRQLFRDSLLPGRASLFRYFSCGAGGTQRIPNCRTRAAEAVPFTFLRPAYEKASVPRPQARHCG